MKYLLLADCDMEELLPLKNGLETASNRSFDVKIVKGNIKVNKHRTGAISDIIRYFWYFVASLSMLHTAKKYETIVCWQQFYALIMSFYCNLFHCKKKTRLVACNYTYKAKQGKLAGIYRWFMKKCLAGDYLDYIHVPSNDYAEIISKEFCFDRNRIIVTPFGIPDEYNKYCDLPAPEGEKPGAYYFSIGRSNRDYDFLIRAWEGITDKLVIAADTYKGKSNNPAVIIRKDITADTQYAWIVNSKALILPIDDGSICSGDTVLLTGMSLNKILIVTRPSTLAEMYIEDGKNGITIPKNESDLRQLIEEIDQGRHNALEHTARISYLENFSRESLGKNIGQYLK